MSLHPGTSEPSVPSRLPGPPGSRVPSQASLVPCPLDACYPPVAPSVGPVSGAEDREPGEVRWDHVRSIWRRGLRLALKALERSARKQEHLVSSSSLMQEEGKGRAETAGASAYNSGAVLGTFGKVAPGLGGVEVPRNVLVFPNLFSLAHIFFLFRSAC